MRITAVRILIAAAILPALAYVGDTVWVRYRMRDPNADRLFGTVVFYYETRLKSGRVEVYFDQPQTELCVHSLFPHAGARPCWYTGRTYVKRIG